MNYKMTTISNETRIRNEHTTFGNIVALVPANTVMEGDELWTALTRGIEVKAGDQWLHVNYQVYTGWMAFRHKGIAICRDLLEVGNEPPPAPDEFVAAYLEREDGTVKKYTLTAQG